MVNGRALIITRGLRITTKTKYSSYFALSRCWLHSLILVTYLCMLLGLAQSPPSDNSNYLEYWLEY
ncbi:hypothetical protein CEQ08_09115 [Providencia rettgeri]|nr:hypothetical protein CEQ08_09115 [Providencia rettgeri]